MKILAIDAATRTGYAGRYRNTGVLVSGVEDFTPKRGSSPGMRFLAFRQWLEYRVQDLQPEVLVYEQAHHRGGAPTEVGVGLATRVMEVAAGADIEYRAVHSQTLKLWATGHGNAPKEAMLAAAQRLFPDVQIVDDNHADAILLLAYAEAGFPVNEKKRARKTLTPRQEATR